MTNPCWPPTGYEILSKAVVGSEDGASFFAECHCQEWRETHFETSDAATAALIAHRGERSPEHATSTPQPANEVTP